MIVTVHIPHAWGHKMANEQAPRVQLADALAELRAELSRARREGEGKDIRFAAKTIEVELSLDFGWKAEAHAGVPKWIPFVEVGAKADANSKTLHKVKLTLEIDTGGELSGGLIFDPDTELHAKSEGT